MQTWTHERIDEGRHLNELLLTAREVDDDVMEERHRLALTMWLGAAIRDGLFDMLDKGLRAAAEPETCKTCGGARELLTYHTETQIEADREPCPTCAAAGPEAKATITCAVCGADTGINHRCTVPFKPLDSVHGEGDDLP